MNKILTLAVSIAAIFIFLGLLPVHGEAEIYDNVMRLHVLANSDSEEDQELKLKVRDKLLAAVSEYNIECDNIDDAEVIVREHINELEKKAQECVKENGFDYPVDIVLVKENYPTKNYEDFCFPSGKYLSLQVKIGDAEGQNWWCVLFPPLCVSAASETSVSAEDALINIGLTSDQYKIITDSQNTTYNVRFKILETVEGIFSK